MKSLNTFIYEKLNKSRITESFIDVKFTEELIDFMAGMIEQVCDAGILQEQEDEEIINKVYDIAMDAYNTHKRVLKLKQKEIDILYIAAREYMDVIQDDPSGMMDEYVEDTNNLIDLLEKYVSEKAINRLKK